MINPVRVTQVRRIAEIPPEYGKMVQASVTEAGQVLWFEDTQGRLRNVVLRGNEPYLIRRSGTLSSTKD